jgi:carotenoid cleavage dioxygenase
MGDETKAGIGRRSFLGAAAGIAGAATAAGGAEAGVKFPTDRTAYARGGSIAGPLSRSEGDLYDCEVEGNIPDGIQGAFYRVGPDFQYPQREGLKPDSWFSGEGHVSMFHIQNGHVDYRSRYVKNTRWKLQHKARKSLYGVYRNPTTDDPSVKGKSRAAHNTQVWAHNGKLLALKEDSRPAAMDLLTLDTLDEDYDFGGQIKSNTFTAHPKTDSVTGNLVAYGYEAKEFGSNDINLFEITPKGKVVWNVWVKAPYTGMLHDYAVTEKYIAFLCIPLAFNKDGIPLGEVHWAWDGSLPTYLGVMRRGGDGKDLRWIKGPQTMCTHTMGCWSDGEKVYVDMDGGESNQFTFFPSRTEPFDAAKAKGRIRRFSVDLTRPDAQFTHEVLFPQVTGALARQDDRYHTQHYRYGFINGADEAANRRGWVMVDHQTGKVQVFSQPDTQFGEMVFIPRRKDAPEADGWLIGVASRLKENGRSDIVIADTKAFGDGAVATIKLPFKVPPQIHGMWVGADQIPAPKA